MLRAEILFCGLVTLACMGCQDSLPATVSGTITIDGQPLAERENIGGEVMLFPSGGGAAAYAALATDGQYTVQTGAAKGLEPGSYKVTVRVVEIEPEPPGGYQHAPKQTLISSPSYQDRENSGITAEIKPGKNTIDFNLTSR